GPRSDGGIDSAVPDGPSSDSMACGKAGQPCCSSGCDIGATCSGNICISADAWAVTGSTTYHWDRSLMWTQNFQLQTQGVGSSLWFGPSEGWACSLGGTMYRWSGSWGGFGMPLGNHALEKIWGLAQDDVWIVGQNIIGHYDGTSWTSRSTPTGIMTGVWAAARN